MISLVSILILEPGLAQSAGMRTISQKTTSDIRRGEIELTDLTEIEMACVDPKDIEDFEKLTKQIESVETYEELMSLLKKRAKVKSCILQASLSMIKI